MRKGRRWKLIFAFSDFGILDPKRTMQLYGFTLAIYLIYMHPVFKGAICKLIFAFSDCGAWLLNANDGCVYMAIGILYTW